MNLDLHTAPTFSSGGNLCACVADNLYFPFAKQICTGKTMLHFDIQINRDKIVIKIDS